MCSSKRFQIARSLITQQRQCDRMHRVRTSNRVRRVSQLGNFTFTRPLRTSLVEHVRWQRVVACSGCVQLNVTVEQRAASSTAQFGGEMLLQIQSDFTNSIAIRRSIEAVVPALANTDTKYIQSKIRSAR